MNVFDISELESSVSIIFAYPAEPDLISEHDYGVFMYYVHLGKAHINICVCRFCVTRPLLVPC